MESIQNLSGSRKAALFLIAMGEQFTSEIFKHLDENEVKKWWDEFEGWIEQLKAPFFYVPGNHDLTNDMMLKKWKKYT